jgi:hypothetical protein
MLYNVNNFFFYFVATFMPQPFWCPFMFNTLTLYSSSNGFSLGKPAAFSRLNWNTLYLLLKKGYSLIRIRIFNVVHLIIVLCKTASWLWKPCMRANACSTLLITRIHANDGHSTLLLNKTLRLAFSSNNL